MSNPQPSAGVQLTPGLNLSRQGYYLIFNNDTGGLQVVAPGNKVTSPPTVGDATHFGVLGATPVVRQTTYTQTYSTAASTVNPASTSAFTGIDNSNTNPVYATVADLNVLRADVLMAIQLLNKLIDNMQAYGLAG